MRSISRIKTNTENPVSPMMNQQNPLQNSSLNSNTQQNQREQTIPSFLHNKASPIINKPQVVKKKPDSDPFLNKITNSLIPNKDATSSPKINQPVSQNKHSQGIVSLPSGRLDQLENDNAIVSAIIHTQADSGSSGSNFIFKRPSINYQIHQDTTNNGGTRQMIGAGQTANLTSNQGAFQQQVLRMKNAMSHTEAGSLLQISVPSIINRRPIISNTIASSPVEKNNLGIRHHSPSQKISQQKLEEQESKYPKSSIRNSSVPRQRVISQIGSQNEQLANIEETSENAQSRRLFSNNAIKVMCEPLETIDPFLPGNSDFEKALHEASLYDSFSPIHSKEKRMKIPNNKANAFQFKSENTSFDRIPSPKKAVNSLSPEAKRDRFGKSKMTIQKMCCWKLRINFRNVKKMLDSSSLSPYQQSARSLRQLNNNSSDIRKNVTPTPSHIENDLKQMVYRKEHSATFNAPTPTVKHQSKSAMGNYPIEEIYKPQINKITKLELFKKQGGSVTPQKEILSELAPIRNNLTNETQKGVSTEQEISSFQPISKVIKNPYEEQKEKRADEAQSFEPQRSDTDRKIEYSVRHQNNKWILCSQQNPGSTNTDLSNKPMKSVNQTIVQKDDQSSNVVSNIVLSYAIKQRQGFIPNTHKPNQDAYFTCKDFAGIQNLWLFGVCDGHGSNGHLVSDFIKKNLPKILEAMIQKALEIHIQKQNGKQQSIPPKSPSIIKSKGVKFLKEKSVNRTILPPLVKANNGNDLEKKPSNMHIKSETILPKIEDVCGNEDTQTISSSTFMKWFKENTDDRDYCIKESFKIANDRLDAITRIDCMMSGSTVVLVLMYQDMILCANAGDSRAVMFSQLNINGSVGGSSPTNIPLKSTPLSRDHKPEEVDEANRIRNFNGRIEQSKILPGTQLFGHSPNASANKVGQYYGPMRVWLKGKQLPGLAMSRSIGDFIAKSVGVTYEPEIKVFTDLTNLDKAVVIASDGIWDRVPNEDVARVIQEFYERRDPQGASQELARIAVDRWQKDHAMVDDITAIVIFLNIHK